MIMGKYTDSLFTDAVLTSDVRVLKDKVKTATLISKTAIMIILLYLILITIMISPLQGNIWRFK
jgi:hypothetical protein